MICLLSVLLNVPAPPATSFHAPIPRSGLVHQAQSGSVREETRSTRVGWSGS